ncbi:MAG: Gfo/Idh/MocA family oxidoreductase [Candidatus Sumerlaeota bacterium]|nr:Gfo/Idh/MocA family oxidoreductase [Candidatus Sumerlaeota bacterium]
MTDIRWGILATGNIAKKFAAGLKGLPDAKLVAVGSRNQAKAQAFAKEFGADRAYGSYGELVRDPGVDIIYVASPHSGHREHTVLCLENGKAVLCEKPFAINEAEVKAMIACARARNLFLMEAMWTRFLPVVCQAREWLHAGAIGTPRMVIADFGFRGGFDPKGRLFDPAGLLDVGIYVVAMASMVFGDEPERVMGAAEIGQTGIDEQAAMILDYGKGARLASLTCGVRTTTPQEAWIMGIDGMIHIHRPFWRSTKATLHAAGKPEETVEIPFKVNGYEFEAEEAGRCLREGLKESPVIPLEESLAMMRTLDRLRAQWGVKYPME